MRSYEFESFIAKNCRCVILAEPGAKHLIPAER